jgi:hypothetical protein
VDSTALPATNVARDAKVPVQTGDEAALKRVRDMGKTVHDDLAAIEAGTVNPERREMVKKIVARASQFTANFELIVKARAERDRAVNEVMNPLDAKLRGEIGEIVDTGMKAYAMEVVAFGGLAQDALVQVRLNLFRYLVEQDDKLFETAEQQFTKLTSSLQRLHEANMKALAKPDVKEKFANAGTDIAPPDQRHRTGDCQRHEGQRH